MKNQLKRTLALLALAAPLATGCTVFNPTGSSSTSSSSSKSSISSASVSTSTSTSASSGSTSTSTGGEGYYVADSTLTDVANYKAMNNSQYCDTVNTYDGEDKELLVLPIEFTDYAFSSQTLNDLENLFNGDGEEDTGYWESLSSFYKKSSYGKFNVHFTIGDVYSTGKTAKGFASQSYSSNEYSDISQIALRGAVDAYKEQNGDDATQEFDKDGDGLIDGVVMIYSCPNYTNWRNPSSAIQNLYWAYCYWDYLVYEDADVSSPIANDYFWCSYDFNYEVTTSPDVDAHTLIHEFGHMCGLDDYYDYDGKTAPMGGLAMMDYNILDQDCFSKTALGWTTPYIVTDSCEITLRPFESSGDCIILSADWNGTAFDEYLIMELYTPTGLNELDATTRYSSRVLGYTKPGIRLLHVDARMTTITDNSGHGSYITDVYKDPRYSYTVAASNSASFCSGGALNKDYDLVRLIEANNVDSLSKSASAYATDKSLFHTGDSFSMSSYQKFFPNKTKLNNGSTLPFEVSFDEVSESGATITITAI